MKHRFALSALFALLSCTAWQSAAVGAPLDIALGAPEGFIASNIRAVGDGRYCVSGAVTDEMGANESAYVLLVDATHRKVLWRTSIPHSHNSIGNTATRCVPGGADAWYATTEEHTNSSEALNQTKVVVNKLSDKGALLKQQALKMGFDEWSYLLQASATGVEVAGGTSATVQRGGSFSTWVSRFDANLQPTQSVKLDNGAFWAGAQAKLDGDNLLLSGEFLPNKGPQGGGHDAYAVARIDLTSRRYVWANYALPDSTTSANTVFATDGSAYTVGITPTGFVVDSLDRAGKTVSSFTIKQPVCGTDALMLSGQTLKVIGVACAGDNPVMASIDLSTKKAAGARTLGEVSAPAFDGDAWVGIVKTQGHGQAFRRDAQ
jgi:hypothetical protein